MTIDTYDDAAEEDAHGDAPTAGDAADAGGAAVARPFICVLFECCDVYQRIYRRPGEAAYRGRCPKCLKTVRVRVGRDGISARMFRAK